MANTKFGRELLCIDKDLPPIFMIRKDSVHCIVDQRNRYGVFFSGSRFANVVRTRFNAFNSYARYFQSNSNIFSPYISRQTREKAAVCATAFTQFPDPGSPGTTTFDGYLYTGSQLTWATAHGLSSAPTTDQTAASDEQMETSKASAASFFILRPNFLFNINLAGNTFSANTFSLFREGSFNNVDSTSIDIVSCLTTSNTSITAGDFAFSNFGTTSFNNTNLSATVDNTYNDYAFNASGISDVNAHVAGVEKLCMMGHLDFTNVAPSAGGTNILSGRYADTAGTGSDPKLTGTYAATPAAVIQSRVDSGVVFSGGELSF